MTDDKTTSPGRDMAEAAAGWLAPAREAFEALSRAALDPGVGDGEFLGMVEAARRDAPGLMAELDGASLAEWMARWMMEGMERPETRGQKPDGNGEAPE